MHTQHRFFVLVFTLTLVATARAADTAIEVVVEPGQRDRTNVPISVAVALPANATSSTVVLTDADGKTLPGQLTKPGLLSEESQAKDSCELHFIAPKLNAGQPAKFIATVKEAANGSGPEGFHWQDTAGQYTDLIYGDRPVLRYMYQPLDDSNAQAREKTYKVYHHVYDPTGKLLVTKGPGGQFTHHRGLFFGFNKVTYDGGKTTDVWHCTNDAHQSHEGFLASEAGPVLGRHRVAVDWHGQKKEVFAREEREVTAFAVPGAALIEWSTRVRTEGGPVKLDGDPQHAGFHFRASQDVGEKNAKQTYYIRAGGTDKPGATINWADKKSPPATVNQPWKGMSFVLGDKRYTVAYLDRPENPKEARFSERDYGRFGSYFEYELTAEKPLDLKYRIWLQEGEMTGDQIAKLDSDFTEPVKVTASTVKQ